MLASVKKLDDLGRVVLPADIRRAMSLTAGSLVEVCLIDGRSIVIRRHRSECTLCGQPATHLMASGSGLCGACYQDALTARPVREAL